MPLETDLLEDLPDNFDPSLVNNKTRPFSLDNRGRSISSEAAIIDSFGSRRVHINILMAIVYGLGSLSSE